jgi:hypothetical protein
LGYPYIEDNHLKYISYHLIIAVVGWVAMVIMGVTFKLIPMFTLSHKFSKSSGKWAFVLINVGLVGFLYELHAPGLEIIYLISALFVVVGLFFFLYQVYIIFKQRIRKKLDAALKYTRLSFIFLGISTIFSSLFLFIDYTTIQNISLAIGYFLFIGFISFLIVGQMYKILPFLTWYHKYSKKAGLEKVPMLKDMYNEKLSYISYYSMLIAVVFVPLSVLMNLGILILFFFTVMLLGVLLFVFNMFKIITG